MAKNKDEIKQKIILAAIEAIEKNGLYATTSRIISKEAGVNVASINYYFGSQENLIEAALNLTMDNAFLDPLNEFIKRKENLYNAFEHVLTDLFQGAVNYPGVTKAHFYSIFVHNDYEGMAAKRYNKFLNQITDVIIEVRPGLDKVKVVCSVMQIFSVLLSNIIFPHLYDKYSGIDFKKEENQKKYIKHLLEKFFRDGELIE